MQIEKALTAQRITIRDYRKSDLPFVTAMWFDPENGKYMSDPTEDYVDDKYQKALDELEDNPEGYYLTVVSNDTGDVIGTCCMFPDEKKEVYDIGYCIHKRYWRQGYGSELIRLLIDWVRAHGGIALTGEVAKENLASNRLLQKHGFQAVRETSFKKYRMGICFESYIYRLNLQ